MINAVCQPAPRKSCTEYESSQCSNQCILIFLHRVTAADCPGGNHGTASSHFRPSRQWCSRLHQRLVVLIEMQSGGGCKKHSNACKQSNVHDGIEKSVSVSNVILPLIH